MDCMRNDISERLVVALYPKEFPEESREIGEHVKTCSECREELEMMQQLYDNLTENRSELAPCVSPCPPAEALVDFSLGVTSHKDIQSHIQHCPACRKQVELAKQLESEKSGTDRPGGPTTEEKIIMRNAIRREYGASTPESKRSVAAFFRSILFSINFPSLALGAVAAAILVVVLAPPWQAKEMSSRLVLSDARWESVPQTMTKTAEVAKKVAVIILVQDGSSLSMKEAEDLYGKVDLSKRLSDQYELISPDDVKKALGASSGKPSDVPEASRLVFDKTDAEYVLAFRIGRSGAQMSLACSLFERSQKNRLGFTSWDEVAKDRLADKIMRIGTEMLPEG